MQSSLVLFAILLLTTHVIQGYRMIINKRQLLHIPCKSSAFKLYSRRPSSSSSVTYDSLNWNKVDYTNKSQYNTIDQCNIITFNMLAPCYKRLTINSTKSREAIDTDKWHIRAHMTLQFMLHEICPNATILALQEFWLYEEYYNIFQQAFDKHGFELRYLRRTGNTCVCILYAQYMYIICL